MTYGATTGIEEDDVHFSPSLNTNNNDNTTDDTAPMMSSPSSYQQGQGKREGLITREEYMRRQAAAECTDAFLSCYTVTVKGLIWACFIFVVGWAVVRIKTNSSTSYAYGGSITSTAPSAYTGPVEYQSGAYNYHKYSNSLPGVNSAQPPLNDGLVATAINEYSPLGLKLFKYPFLDGAMLIEPHRETTIVVDGMTGGCNLFWKITNVNDPDLIFHGIEDEGIFDFKVTLTKTGEYTLKIEEECTHVHYATMTRILDMTIWVKYVRRELMSLTDKDREEFLDAFRTLWDVSTKQGISKYGPKYKSLHYFAMIHNDGGANPICDEFHAGTGFLNNHVYLGMYLEQSLRLVNPKVSLHYMDYSKYFGSPEFYTGHLGNTMDGGSWTEILSSKWFGKNDPLTGELVDGRWAGTKVPLVDEKFLNEEGLPLDGTFFPDEEAAWLAKAGNHIRSPYGLLRAPWNYNPSPYLARYNNLNRISTAGLPEHAVKPYVGSNCQDLRMFFQLYTVGQPLQLYLESTEDAVHGYIHFTFGGSGGDRAAKVDEELRNTYGFTDTYLFYVAESAHKFVKTYLSGIDSKENPMSCTAAPEQTGSLPTTAYPGEPNGPVCKCADSYFESETNLNALIQLYFNHFMGNDVTILVKDFETKKKIMQLVCSRMSYEGDMAGSGAAMDPLFWVVHGAVERVFQRVILDDVLTDTAFTNSKRGGTCSGHIAAGKKTWLAGFYFEDPAVDAAAMTNAELANVLDPRSDAYRDLIDSVYDTMDYPWCDGFDQWLHPVGRRRRQQKLRSR